MPSSRFLFDETRKFPTHNVHRSRPVRILDFEQCCKVVIGYDVPEHPLAFAVQYATCAEGLTSCMAADAAPHLAMLWILLLSTQLLTTIFRVCKRTADMRTQLAFICMLLMSSTICILLTKS